MELPAELTCIQDFAFASCKNLTKIVIPVAVEKIGANAFASAGKYVMVNMEYVTEWPFVIQTPAGSYAETYAQKHNIPFVAE